MHPYLAGVELYWPMLALAAFSVVALLLWRIYREGFALLPVLAYLLLLTVATFVGAKGFSILFHGGMRSLPTELSGGLRFPGALIGVAGSAWLLRGMLPSGLTLLHLADLWAPCFSLACAIGRAGCLLMGCCYGAVSQLPWSIRYPRGSTVWWAHFDSGRIESAAAASLPVHPFPVYLLSLELALFAFTSWLIPRRAFDGQVVLVFLALHGVLKSAIEFTRDPYDPLHQAVLLPALAAIAWLVVVQRRRRELPAATATGA